MSTAPVTRPTHAEPSSVPFLDLAPSHEGLRDPILAEIGELFDSGFYSNGRQVAAFESDFARYCGVAHCVGMGSGLDALRLALIAADVRPGDEVVVPASTFIATVEAVSQAGARPVVVDISETDYGLDAGGVEAAIGDGTRFIMPVHLYGQMADMQELAAVARRRGIEIVEDACQAHGAERDGLRAGTIGIAAAFSFYPGKNLGAIGDAGALVTRDPELAETARALREHGQRTQYLHDLEGYTARLDTIQAIMLLHKLPLLEQWTAERQRLARCYGDALAGTGDVVLPPVPAGSSPVWHRYVIRTREPDRLAAFLRERGVGTARNYPQPIHLMGAYAGLGYSDGEFPIAERLSREALSLPLYPGLSEPQLDYVATSVAAFFAGPQTSRSTRNEH